MRQSGVVESGHRVNIYAADMRHVVCKQFFPEGFDWNSDQTPIVISEGFSSHQVHALPLLLCAFVLMIWAV